MEVVSWCCVSDLSRRRVCVRSNDVSGVTFEKGVNAKRELPENLVHVLWVLYVFFFKLFEPQSFEQILNMLSILITVYYVIHNIENLMEYNISGKWLNSNIIFRFALLRIF